MNAITARAPLVEAKGLTKVFASRSRVFSRRSRGGVHAVDGVDLSIQDGETLGLVGESGCGKSTTGRLLLRLIEPTAGRILYSGEDIMPLARSALRARRRNFQIIFQDPFGSLNPRLTVEQTLTEPFAIHRIGKREDRALRVQELLDLVRLPRSVVNRYPHEFSGGQRQRIGIARALALRPSFLVCDEAVSALDVSVQAQIVNLLQDLQSELGLTYLFISHNLAVVRHISTRIAVMYLGRIVEIANSDELFSGPAHPYTQALLAAIPPSHPDERRFRHRLAGDLPSAQSVARGCRFTSRCPHAVERCKIEDPALEAAAGGRLVACHRVADGTLPNL